MSGIYRSKKKDNTVRSLGGSWFQGLNKSPGLKSCLSGYYK